MTSKYKVDLIKITFLALFFSKAVSTNICRSQTACKCVKDLGHVVDLSSLGKTEGFPLFYEIAGNVSDVDAGLYSYNPCYEFDSSSETKPKEGNHPCSKAAACVTLPGNADGQPAEKHAIGLQATGNFGSTDKFGFHINYTVPHSLQFLTVQLKCNEAVEHHLEVNQLETEDNPHIVMTLTSKCVCDNICGSGLDPYDESGLSTGSKLLIAFFTIALAYFLVGIIWNFFNGAQGPELIPNYDFWNDLPKLIIEGVAFSCSFFGKRESYGEV